MEPSRRALNARAYAPHARKLRVKGVQHEPEKHFKKPVEGVHDPIESVHDLVEGVHDPVERVHDPVKGVVDA